MAAWVHALDLAGVVVFALSGVVLACQRRLDPFGVLVLAAVTGIGGGTLRDLLLGVRPVFWVARPEYLWAIIATVVLALAGLRYLHRLSRLWLPVLDAFGLALFTVLGAHKALTLHHAGVVAVLMGMLTGVAGGMVRDVLARRVPLVMRREIYATASLLGGTLYVAAQSLGLALSWSVGLGVGVTLLLRLAAIRWHLSLPVVGWREA